MHVVSYKRIREFTKEHPDSLVSLSRWYRKMKKGKFSNQNEMMRRFPGVDYLGNDRYIFNISGNKFRLVAVVFISTRIVLIRFIGTHKDYDRINVFKI